MARRHKNPIHKHLRKVISEQDVIAQFIEPGDVVVDVGANKGSWSKVALAHQSDIRLFMVEAAGHEAEALRTQFPSANVTHAAVSDSNAPLTFYRNPANPTWSSLYKRDGTLAADMVAQLEPETVPGITLDQYWPVSRGLIHFLKLDVEGAEFDALRGANDVLRRGGVNYMQFEYGGTFKDADRRLEETYFLLRQFGYFVLRLTSKGLQEITAFSADMEDYKYANYLAVNERLRARTTGMRPKLEPFLGGLKEFGVTPRGVLHVGAHQGAEVETYLGLGCPKVALFEANPKLAEGLRQKFSDYRQVRVIEAAVSEQEGRATFNITSNDQSSSLLPLGNLTNIYPSIKQSDTIEVRTARLDDLLNENGMDAREYNILSMDIQGAELMALKGSQATLAGVELIQVEVNYAELYEGCPLIWDLDAHLEPLGFRRVRTSTPFHRDWGDAIYLRSPTISVTNIGTRGRFANQMFQYIFPLVYGIDHGLEARTNPWDIGEALFNVTPGTQHAGAQTPSVNEVTKDRQLCNVVNHAGPMANRIVNGFFQFHSSYYRRHRALIGEHFTFGPAYAPLAEQMRTFLDGQPGTKVVVHLRRGDYGYGQFFIAPTDWYVAWLRALQAELGTLSVYIASDDLDLVRPDFAEFNTISAADVGLAPHDIGFFADFCAMTLADNLAISNSSFSFIASMLNTRNGRYMRPSLKEKSLVAYDPWADTPLLRDVLAEDAGTQYMRPGAPKPQSGLSFWARIFGAR